jgi:hypothetical protein
LHASPPPWDELQGNTIIAGFLFQTLDALWVQDPENAPIGDGDTTQEKAISGPAGRPPASRGRVKTFSVLGAKKPPGPL